METLVVNLFGTPSAGKSTGSAYIFSQLKMNGINAELVTEFTKDKVWEDNKEVFKNELYILGKQSFKLSRVKDKVDVIVTDRPLALSILYNNSPILGEPYNQVVMNVFNSYNNINFLIKRIKPYNPIGRNQTEEEADALHQPLTDLLKSNYIPYKEVYGDVSGYKSIVTDILLKLNK